MKIYLDDLRGTPDTWHRCYKIEEVQRLLCEALLGGEEITHMSLDHDLGASYLCGHCYEYGEPKCTEIEHWHDCDAPGGGVCGCGAVAPKCHCDCHEKLVNFPDGYVLVKWMAQHDMWPTNKPMVHSANPGGRVNMIVTIEKHWHPPDGR